MAEETSLACYRCGTVCKDFVALWDHKDNECTEIVWCDYTESKW